MENMIPMLAGGLRKRPGTWFGVKTRNNAEARLIYWPPPDGSCRILEITAGRIRVLRARPDEENNMIFSTTGGANIPHTAQQVQELHYAINKKEMWLVHPEQPPVQLRSDPGFDVFYPSTAPGSDPTLYGIDFTLAGNRPKTVAFYAGRLCFAGTDNNPNRIYMSKAMNSQTGQGRHTDFTAGSNPADAIILEENDMYGSRIQWLAASRRLVAATGITTWSDNGEVPTPATFDMNIVEHTGSSHIQPRGTKEIMVYVGRYGKSLRALVWNENGYGGGYIDMDTSERAAHLFSAGIKDFAVMDNPFPMIWIVTKAGELISCTINIRGGVLAYARHPMDGIVEAVTIARQGTDDVVFLVVKRGDDRNIEYMILEDLVNSDFTDSHYVDAGELRTYNTPEKTITGLGRFAGKTIRAFADGAILPPIHVDEQGIAELQTAVSKIHLGLPYKAAFSPNERQIPANGTSLGKKRRIEKITLRLYKSIGGRAGTTEEKATELIMQRFGSYELGSAPEPFTGEIDVTVSGNIDTEGKLVITHEEPVPFTMLALVERVAILEA